MTSPLSPAPREPRPTDMWGMIGELLFGDGHSVRRAAIFVVLLALAGFAVWKSFPESVRADLLKPAMARWNRHPAVSMRVVAKDSADALEDRIPRPAIPFRLVYFDKVDEKLLRDVLVPRLQQRGYAVTDTVGPRSERSNSVWCGSLVPTSECVLVALRMLQTGYPLTQVFRFPPTRDRPQMIQIGYNANLGTADTLTVVRLMSMARNGIVSDLTPR